PTVSIANFTEIDGGPYPSSSEGPIHTFSDALTLVKGRHTFKAGAVLEYSGEDDFDQINVQAIPGSTNNQNGGFEFLDNRASGSCTTRPRPRSSTARPAGSPAETATTALCFQAAASRAMVPALPSPASLRCSRSSAISRKGSPRRITTPLSRGSVSPIPSTT